MKLKIMKRIFLLVLAVLTMLFCSSRFLNEEVSQSPEKLRVTCIIPSRVETSFWRDIETSMQKASDELDVDITMMYSGTDGRLAIANSDAVEIAILADTQAIVTAYRSEDQKTAELLRRARNAGIRVVLMDSDNAKDIRDMFVGIDNAAAGFALGRTALEKIGDDRTVLLLTSGSVHPNMIEREEAIRYAFEASPEVLKIIDAKRQNDLQLVSLLEEQLSETSDIGAIITTIERNTIICAQVLKRLEMTDSIALYGFDRSDDTMPLLETGDIQALICQRHTEMGYESIKAAVNLIRGMPNLSDTQTIDFEILYTDWEKGD